MALFVKDVHICNLLTGILAMRYYFNLIIHFILLITTPTLLANSQAEQVISNQSASLQVDLQDKILTLDDLLEFVDGMESGNLENYTPEQLEVMIQFLVVLARNGVFPGEEEERQNLEEDIQELVFNLSEFLSPQIEGIASFPVRLHERQQAGIGKWFSKKWKHVKHFCKDHKKELLIGSAVVVSVVGIAYIAAATTGILETAGAAGAAVLSNQPDSSKENTSNNKTQDTSIKRMIIDDMSYVFKENGEVDKTVILDDEDVNANYATAEEILRSAAAKITHEIFDGVSDAASVLPSLMDDVVAVKDHLLPEEIALLLATPRSSLGNEDEFNHIERYENDVANIHEAIDNIFSTDLANAYTPEAKEQRKKDVALGLIPPPQGLATEAGKIVNVAGKYVPKKLASDVWGWKPGQQINNRTRFGRVPKWDTVRKRYWKNQSYFMKNDPNYKLNYDYATPANMHRMEKGLAPQQFNPITGQLESKELHHVPPQREGGLFDFIELWPNEHAAVDKYRHTGR